MAKKKSLLEAHIKGLGQPNKTTTGKSPQSKATWKKMLMSGNSKGKMVAGMKKSFRAAPSPGLGG